MNDLYSRAPHRPAAPADAHSPHAALLIDFDNWKIMASMCPGMNKKAPPDWVKARVKNYPQHIDGNDDKTD